MGADFAVIFDRQLCFFGDADGSFTKALGTDLDLTAAGLGPGIRSNRFSMFVTDGVIVQKVRFRCLFCSTP